MIDRIAAAKKEPEKVAGLKGVKIARELDAEELRFAVTLDSGFTTTGALAAVQDFTGQERALAALELGLGVMGGGFNIFVSGLAGAERLQALQRWVAQRGSAFPTPGDWVYVHNFQHPDAPRAIYLQAGEGIHLRQKMRDLVKSLKEELPKAFRQEEFDREKGLLREKYARRAQEMNSQFAKLVREKGFRLHAGPGGDVLFIPLVDGKPLKSPEEFSRLSPEEQGKIEKWQEELVAEMAQMASRQREVMREMEADIRQVERRFCDKLLSPLITGIEREMENEKVSAYLAEVREQILDNLEDFKEGVAAPSPFLFVPPTSAT